MADSNSKDSLTQEVTANNQPCTSENLDEPITPTLSDEPITPTLSAKSKKDRSTKGVTPPKKAATPPKKAATPPKETATPPSAPRNENRRNPIWFFIILAVVAFCFWKFYVCKPLKVGDTVVMGTYCSQQIKNSKKEPITWRVWKVEKDRALLVSDEILDDVTFPNGFHKLKDCDWSVSQMREMLNNDFYSDVFKPWEKIKIMTVSNNSGKNTQYNTINSRKSNDKVFLLSIEEVEQYQNNQSNKSVLGNYLISRFNGLPYQWLLRTPGKERYSLTYVGEDGVIDYDGITTTETQSGSVTIGVGLRPAMWVKQ